MSHVLGLISNNNILRPADPLHFRDLVSAHFNHFPACGFVILEKDNYVMVKSPDGQGILGF